MKKKDYIPIRGLGTGRGTFRAFVRSRLYSSEDHLLIVQSTGYTEDYRRIFYRDIRYVIARKNNVYPFANLILGLLIALHLLFYYLGMPPVLAIIILVVLGLLLVINLVRGPTCSCYLNTEVQTVFVPTPSRRNKIPVLIEFLKTKIPAAEAEAPAT
jgi:hypothetical protein